MKRGKLSFEDFVIKDQIGTGSFGKVFSAIYSPTQTECAVKIIDLESSQDDIEEIQKEIEMLASCKNDHITKYFGCFVYGFELWIVMEYLNAGSCLDLLKSMRPKLLQEPIVAEILYQFLSGLAYLHRSGKIHRDIKAANILVAGNGVIKIADFGVAAQLSTYLSRRNTFVGTPFWMAPEVIDQLDYSFEADIWSFGITAIELACGKPPWAQLHPMKALMVIPHSDPPRLDEKFSRNFRDFVAQCLQIDPNKRANIDVLLRHPFIKSRDSRGLQKLIARQLVNVQQTKKIEKEKQLEKERENASSFDQSTTLKALSVDDFDESEIGEESRKISSNEADDTEISDSDPSKNGPRSNTKSAANGNLNLDNGINGANADKNQLTENVDINRENEDYWDFDTIKPQQPLKKILENPPSRDNAHEKIDSKSNINKQYNRRSDAILPLKTSQMQSGITPLSASKINTENIQSMNIIDDIGLEDTMGTVGTVGTVGTLGTVNTLGSGGTVNSSANLSRIFSHAARKFNDPILEEISNLLRTDPLTVGVESYLIKKIGKQAVQHFDIKPKDKHTSFDAVEQILLEKYMTEIEEVHKIKKK